MTRETIWRIKLGKELEDVATRFRASDRDMINIVNKKFDKKKYLNR